jgi:hypothetical protein
MLEVSPGGEGNGTIYMLVSLGCSTAFLGVSFFPFQNDTDAATMTDAPGSLAATAKSYGTDHFSWYGSHNNATEHQSTDTICPGDVAVAILFADPFPFQAHLEALSL